MIDHIDARVIAIDMRRPFRHARYERSVTSSVLVAVEAHGRCGWGESAPRPYVTDETAASVVATLRSAELDRLHRLVDAADFCAAICGLAQVDLVGWLHGRQAAAAGLEIALFDLICQLHNQGGLAALLCLPATARLLRPAAAPTPVTLVLDLATESERSLAALPLETLHALRHVKLKATSDVDACVKRVGIIQKQLAGHTRISVDVNGVWDEPAALDGSRRLQGLGVAWLEEPVAARDWATMHRIRRSVGMPIMLDESCCGVADLRAAAQARAADYINVRISKCGGIFPALRLVDAAQEAGLGVQLGVHVGEVGPLWAAARLLSCSIPSWVSVEAGRQDEWFPQQLTDPPYAIDRRAYVAHPLNGIGIGIKPSQALLDHWYAAPTVGGGHS